MNSSGVEALAPANLGELLVEPLGLADDAVLPLSRPLATLASTPDAAFMRRRIKTRVCLPLRPEGEEGKKQKREADPGYPGFASNRPVEPSVT